MGRNLNGKILIHVPKQTKFITKSIFSDLPIALDLSQEEEEEVSSAKVGECD